MEKGGLSLPEPTPDYYPTLIRGVCKNCHVLVELVIGPGFDFRCGDRIMDGKAIKAHCEWCDQDTEFVPLPKELQMKGTTLGNIQTKAFEEKGIAPK